MDPLQQAFFIGAAGMTAQVARLRTVAQNIANANTTGLTPDSEPYRRKTIHFHNVLDRALGTQTVQVRAIREDPSPFRLQYEPGHPAADERGYVRYPNVVALIEMNDYRQASRSYEASLNALRQTRQLARQTVDLLRSQ